jgi:hypothetical protein
MLISDRLEYSNVFLSNRHFPAHPPNDSRWMRYAWPSGVLSNPGRNIQLIEVRGNFSFELEKLVKVLTPKSLFSFMQYYV